MTKILILLGLLIATLLPLRSAAQEPLYVVNGVVREQIQEIPPEDIEQVEMLPADEQTVARYGPRANHGVMLVTLRYDIAARFGQEESFSDYIARQVTWGQNEPAARIILRYIITPTGQTVIDKELVSTDNRLKRRILKAVAAAPHWQPAMRKGVPVQSKGTLQIQLPVGKPMPRQVELVFR